MVEGRRRHVDLLPHSRREGWVYVVALIPELDLRRIKVGFTRRPIGDRLRAFRTANPHAVLPLLGQWEADRTDEIRAHRVVPGRREQSEVFDCGDLHEALRLLDMTLGDPEEDAEDQAR
jgi:hypothetical protein